MRAALAGVAAHAHAVDALGGRGGARPGGGQRLNRLDWLDWLDRLERRDRLDGLLAELRNGHTPGLARDGCARGRSRNGAGRGTQRKRRSTGRRERGRSAGRTASSSSATAANVADHVAWGCGRGRAGNHRGGGLLGCRSKRRRCRLRGNLVRADGVLTSERGRRSTRGDVRRGAATRCAG